MRWERLLADLSAQYEAEQTAEFDAEVAERLRHETGQIRLVQRLLANSEPVQLGVAPTAVLAGRLASVGPDWLLLDAAADELLVALAAVDWVAGVGSAVAPLPTTAVWSRRDLRLVVRSLARARAPVRLHLRSGGRWEGTVDRVYADHLELACHPLDEPRRASAVRSARALPLSALAYLTLSGS